MKDKKIIIIGATRYVKGVERWMKTIVNTQPEHVQPVLIKYHPWPESKKIPKEFKVYDMGKEGWPGNNGRHKDVPKVIADFGVDKWYVWSDTMDVIFQEPLPTLDKFNVDTLTTPENTLHRNSNYWWARMSPKEKEVLADEVIRNGGLHIIKGSAYLKFIKYLKDNNHVPNDDQACYNRWLATTNIKELRINNLLCMGGGREDEYEYVDGKYVCKDNNKPYLIVHANGDSKPVLNKSHPIKDYIGDDE